MFRSNQTKAKLLAGKTAFGTIHSLAHPPVAELIGLAGYDFVMIDGEHGLGNDSAHMACLHAVSATPANALLRVPGHEPVAIRRALDLGFEGLLVPDVRNAKQAQAIANCCFYPPRGKRGFAAGLLRASDYGLAVESYVKSDASEFLLCLMIESAEGVKNVQAIAEIDGVDVIQLGPFDLSYDLGIPGQFDHPKFVKALERIEKGTRAAGKILGGLAMPGQDCTPLIERGYSMLTIGADLGMLAAALKSALPQVTVEPKKPARNVARKAGSGKARKKTAKKTTSRKGRK